MTNKILTIPFFVFMFMVPVGVLLLMTMIPIVEANLAMYGEWSFKQWESKYE